ncbi:MAG: uroporphyrinogen decarboxylase family protein [Holophaga sp.]
MNSLERVLACLGGQPVDRPAFSLLLALYGARLTGATLKEHYSDPQVFVEGQIAVWETFGPDLLFGPYAFPSLAEAFGGTLHHHAAQAPTMARPPFASAQEALARWSPEPTDHPVFRYLTECTRGMAAHFADQVPVIPSMPSPADLPVFLLGAEGWLDTLLFDEPAAQTLLERATTFCVTWGRQLLESGGLALGVTADFSNPEVLPERFIRTLTLPALRDCFSQLPGPLVFHHGGCRLAPHLALLGGLPGVAGYVLDPRDGLAEGRQRVGPGPLLLGGLNGPSFEGMEPDAMKTHCLTVLDERHADPNFILASGNADIPLHTAPAVIQAVRAAALEWKRPSP